MLDGRRIGLGGRTMIKLGGRRVVANDCIA